MCFLLKFMYWKLVLTGLPAAILSRQAELKTFRDPLTAAGCNGCPYDEQVCGGHKERTRRGTDCARAEAISERLKQVNFLVMVHHFAWPVMGWSLRCRFLRGFIPGLLLTADLPFLPLLHSLMILGHWPNFLGKFPADRHEDDLSWTNAV